MEPVTQNVNNFIINIGRSSRRKVNTGMLTNVQKIVDQAQIGDSDLSFERNGMQFGRVVSGEEISRRTIISVVSDKVLKKINMPTIDADRGYAVDLHGSDKTVVSRMLRKEGIRLRNPKEVNSFIFLSEHLFKSIPRHETLAGRLTTAAFSIFHEIGHIFSSESGAADEDLKLTSLLDTLSTTDPTLNYRKVAQAQMSALTYNALEESRADSVAVSFLNRTAAANYLEDDPTGLIGYGQTKIQRHANELSGYGQHGAFGSYNETRYQPKVDELMKELASRPRTSNYASNPLGLWSSLERALEKSKGDAVWQAHETYGANLSAPNISVTKRVSPFPVINRTGEFAAQASLVKPSALPTLSRDALNATEAVISSVEPLPTQMPSAQLKRAISPIEKSIGGKTTSRIISGMKTAIGLVK